MSDQDPSKADPAPVVGDPPSSQTAEASSDSTDAPPAEVPSGGTKADLGKRALALVIDVVPVTIVGFVAPLIGGLVGAAYMLLRDGMDLDFMNHRSFGKNVMKLRVDSLAEGSVDPLTSIKRNWMFAIGPLGMTIWFIPIAGPVFLAFIVLPVVFFCFFVEVVLALTDSEGRRLGDKIAGTVVRQD